MAKIDRSLAVEKALDTHETKRDIEILKDVSKDLPSAAKVKLFKKEDEAKLFIASIPAEDIQSLDVHEYIKSKYSKKHGGGDYILELLDSNANIVDRRIISIIDDSISKNDDAKHTKLVEEALTMREEAFEKVKEVEHEKRKVESAKYETIINSMERQWDTIQKMYESQVDVLKEQLKAEPDKNTQFLIQMQIDKINRDFDASKNKLEMDMKNTSESRVATEKMFDLVNTLIPIIISSKEVKDPVTEFSKILNVVNTVTGGKKDIIESFLESPEKLSIFQKILGVNNNGKKDVFEEILENPLKAEAFKRVLGIEDKKDFLVEMLENPTKFDVFKKVTGMDKQDELIREIKNIGNMATTSSMHQEPKKDFIDELVEAKTKYEALKNMFSPSQPAKTFVELVSSILSNAGPYISQAVQSYMNGMVTLEMVKKGMIKNPTGMPIMGQQLVQAGGYGETLPELPPSQEKMSRKNDIGEEKKVNIDDLFKQTIANILSKQKEPIESHVFISMMSDNIVTTVKQNPSLVFSIMKYGGFDNITDKMAVIITELLGLENDIALDMSKQIANTVIEKMKG